MKTGKSILELAQEITRQQTAKRDFLVPKGKMEMQIAKTMDKASGADRDEPRLVLHNGHPQEFPLTQYAHGQVSSKLAIPKQYYDRMMAEAPHLLAMNVNEWLGRSDDKRMVRTLDGNVRALLSDKYRPLENADLAEAVLPVLNDLKVEIISCEITATRLYIKAVDKRIEKDIPTGRKMGDGSHVFFDTLSPAITIGNSEVGAGTLFVNRGILTKACTNLATIEKAVRKYHVGARADIGEDVYELLSDRTKQVSDAAIFMQVRDVVKAAFEEAQFVAMAERVTGMVSDRLHGDLDKVVEVAAKTLGMHDSERGSVLKHLAEGGDLTRYGLFNAVTRTAEDLGDYDRATEFEKMGGQIIELPRSDWQRIANAGQERLAA